MGWRSQENYELTNERDFNGLPWRDRTIIQRAGWVCGASDHVRLYRSRAASLFRVRPNRSYTAVSNVRKQKSQAQRRMIGNIR
jgi:hypothetical protein